MRPGTVTTLRVIRQRAWRQLRKQHSGSNTKQWVGSGVGVVAALLLMAGSLLAVWAYMNVTSTLPSVAKLPALLDAGGGQFFTPTRFYDRSGAHLLLSLENPGITGRTISLDQHKAEHLPHCLSITVQSILDPGFWQHPGFNWNDLTSDKTDTLAQRLASELLLQDEPPSLKRNLRQRLLAAQITATYGREKVLEWFLNSVYFGHLAYGVEEAAQLYLGKPASQLDWSESALLTALIQAPALNPLDAPEAARQNQRLILKQLLAAGIINQKQEELYAQEELHFRSEQIQTENPAKAFLNKAIEQVTAMVGQSRLERGGLNILTTLDFDLQQQMACAVHEQLVRSQSIEDNLVAAGNDCSTALLLPTLPPVGNQALPHDLAASGVILDPQTGQVLALLGDTNLTGGESQVLKSHPSGTLLTPFIYLAGFTQGSGPASLVWDIPANLPEDALVKQNFDGQFHGPQRLRFALANDYLAPAAQMLAQVGTAHVWEELSNFGLPQLSDETLPYEGGSLSPLQAAQVYGIFAGEGVLAGQLQRGNLLQPALLLKVTDQQGRTWVDWGQAVTRAIISTPLSYLVNNILTDESSRWPSLGYPNALEIGRPAGAKLGQTPDGRHTWVAGYTPQRVVIVWVGSAADQVENSRLDPRLAAGLWHALIQYTNHDLPSLGWQMPAGISVVAVCDPSGLLPTSACPNVVNEVFLNGNEPTAYDNLYRKVQINRETGRLATIFTPLELVDERVFMIVPPEARSWAEATGLPIPPVLYDSIKVLPVQADVNISSPALFSAVSGIVSIQGTAGGSGLASYRLQVGQGLNPQAWLQIGDEGTGPVIQSTLVTWDTRQQTDGLYALRLVAVYQDQHVVTAVIQVTVDNTPPSIELLYPLDGASLTVPAIGTIVLQAQADDAVGLDRVEFWLDGSLLGSLTQPPFSYPWQAAPGEHRLLVKVYDKAGNLGQSAEVKFTVTGVGR